MGDAEAQERLIPFDRDSPRIMSAKEWAILEKGPEAAGCGALNMFLRDIYHGREVLRAQLSFRTT